MRRLMTGYAVKFNLRHKRKGHLFQNRYKAVLCDWDGYFLELVAYIHLNPLRAGLVEDLKGLRGYKWCGHNALVRRDVDTFLVREEVLGHFGRHLRGAMKGYESYLAERVKRFRKGELSGED
jgi:putative transposase